MVTNSNLTVFHKELDEKTRLEKWIRYNYSKVWWFETKGSSLNKGYAEKDNIQIRIPYHLNKNANINHFSIGDIICKGRIEKDIISQSDLPKSYNITSINNNTVGSEPHIHLGGK